MTGVITSLPPLIEQPPGNASSNPAGLPGYTYTVALLGFAQTWTAKQTFPLGMITLNAADITGTLPFGVMPLPSASTLGGIFSKTNVSNQWINSIGTDGLPTSSQPAFTNISGSVAATQMPALTGDITTTAGAVATTLATVNGNVGSFGTATQVSQFTVNAKGLITAAVNVTMTPAIGSVTGLGTGVATALGINVGTAGSPVVNGGALGTPSSGTLTSVTGLPVSTGISGLGTGVATALGVNTGTAGSHIVNGGVLGTPSSGTLTNATGYTVANLADVAWTAYTPSSAFTTPGTSVMGAANGRWKLSGKTVFFSIDCTCTTVGTGTGSWTVGLPTATAANQIVGASGKEVITLGVLLAAQSASTTTINVVKYDNTSLALGGNGTRIVLLGSYEAA